MGLIQDDQRPGVLLAFVLLCTMGGDKMTKDLEFYWLLFFSVPWGELKLGCSGKSWSISIKQ